MTNYAHLSDRELFKLVEFTYMDYPMIQEFVNRYSHIEHELWLIRISHTVLKNRED